MKRIIFVIIALLPFFVFAQKSSEDIISIINNVKILYEKGAINDAISLVKSNKKKFEQVDGGTVLYHKLLGSYYATLSQNDKSEREFNAIISDASVNASPKDKAEAFFGVASAYFSLGDLRKAEDAFLQSYQLYKQLDLEDDPYVREVLVGLGSTYFYLKDNARASQYFVDAKYLYEKNLDFSLGYVNCLKNYAMVLSEQKDFFWAKCLIDVASSTLQGISSLPNSDVVLPIISSMSTIYADMGYNDESIDIIQKGLALYGNSNGNTVSLYNNLAVHAITQKRYKAAVKLLKMCVPLSDIADKNEILFNLAYAQWLDNDPEAGSTIRNIVESIVNDVSSKFCFLSNKEREKYWNYYNPYLHILNAWLVLNATKQDNADLYNNALFAKGLLLRTSNRIREQIEQSDNSELKKQFNEMLALQKQLEEQPSANDSIKNIQERINLIDKNLTKLVQGYVSADDLRTEYDWRYVKNSLNTGDCAIEFMMIPPWEGDSINADFDYYAAIIKRDYDSPILVKLGKESEINAILGRSKSLPLNRYVTNLYKWGARTQGEKIYKKIWEPVEPYLADVKNVFFSPIGILNAISFNAITKDTVCIGQTYNLYQLTSTNLIKSVKEYDANSKPATALVYGGVLYDAEEKELVAEARCYPSDNLQAWSVDDQENNSTRSGWSYLPGTKIEAETVFSTLDSAGIETALISGCKANEESFKKKAGDYELIHIATHGFFLADPKEVALNPFVQGHRSIDTEPSAMTRSGLLLAGANRRWTGQNAIPGIEDGILTAEEISNVNLSTTKLVVLSACETGLGEIKSNEGVFGLQRAFKLAGAQSLIMSLWKVDDNATMLLMNTFYDNWMKGMPKHDAFNKAIDAIREQFKSPYYWAAFVMLD